MPEKKKNGAGGGVSAGWGRAGQLAEWAKSCCSISRQPGDVTAFQDITARRLPVFALPNLACCLRFFPLGSTHVRCQALQQLTQLLLFLHVLLLLQVGAGGGMKGGVNIWKAMRDTHSMHPAWMHCAGRAYR
jgi:hypothetical protein